VDCSVSKQSNQAGNGVVVLGTHVGEEVSVAFACLLTWRSYVIGVGLPIFMHSGLSAMALVGFWACF
jgi:hypothetical protein